MATRGRRRLNYILKHIQETTAFVFHQVTTFPFCPSGAFSRISLPLKVHQADPTFQAALRFDDLFKVEAMGSEFDAAIEFISNCRSKPWPVSSDKDTEKTVMIDIASRILVNICNEVTMEKRYSVDTDTMPGLTSSVLGLGSINTWYGTPDVQVGGIAICRGTVDEEKVCGGDEEDSDSDSSNDGTETSDSTAVHIEGKIRYKLSNLSQVTATCVVSSFTERTNHPDKSPLIPTVLIDKTSFRVCLYDCERDVLLISNAKSLCNKGRMSSTGVALLWVVLNHRFFLRGLPDGAERFPAGIRPRLETTGYLPHFISLKSKNVDWDVCKTPYTIEGSTFGVQYVNLGPPPPKKQKKK